MELTFTKSNKVKLKMSIMSMRKLLKICMAWMIGFVGMAVANAGWAGNDEMSGYLAASRAEYDGSRNIAWKQEAAFTFEKPVDMAGFKVVDGDWTVRDGKLIAEAGQANRNRTLLILPVRWDYLCVEFDATLEARPDGRVGDLGIRFTDPGTGCIGKHYTVITGQYLNQASVVYRRSIPIARTEWSPLIPGKVHRVRLEFTCQHLRYWVDERVVIEAWDRLEPINIKGTWLGIHSYDTKLKIDNLVISSGTLKMPGASAKVRK